MKWELRNLIVNKSIQKHSTKACALIPAEVLHHHIHTQHQVPDWVKNKWLSIQHWSNTFLSGASNPVFLTHSQAGNKKYCCIEYWIFHQHVTFHEAGTWYCGILLETYLHISMKGRVSVCVWVCTFHCDSIIDFFFLSLTPSFSYCTKYTLPQHHPCCSPFLLQHLHADHYRKRLFRFLYRLSIKC